MCKTILKESFGDVLEERGIMGALHDHCCPRSQRQGSLFKSFSERGVIVTKKQLRLEMVGILIRAVSMSAISTCAPEETGSRAE